MRTFKDTQEREWKLSINLGVALEVRDRLEVDLLELEAGDPPLLTRLATDGVLLGRIILILIGDQIERFSVTEADVLRSFDGATLFAAKKAFYEELSFFCQSGGRPDRALAIDKQRRILQAAVNVAVAKVEAIDEKAIIGKLSGDPPAS